MRLLLLNFALLVGSLGLTANTVSGSSSVSLNGTWELSFWQQPHKAITSVQQLKSIEVKTIKAQVPGNVEIDMQAAGVIDDPMIGSNVYQLRKYEGYQWCYMRQFDTPKLKSGQRAELFFGGIDCLATVWVNGVEVGTAENMFIEQAYDITDQLNVTGVNTVQVIIRSAVIEGQKYLMPTFSLNNFAAEESTNIRKAPHNYGWDIMPRVVSAGLWRNVELRTLEPTRLTDVHWYTAAVDVANKFAHVYVDFHSTFPFAQMDNTKAVISLSRNGKEVYKNTVNIVSHSMRHMIQVHGADLWWPKGSGDAALYDAQVSLLDGEGKTVSTDNRKIGLRTIQLDHSDINEPENPGRFCFIVNGEKVFIRGTNWVPLDAMHSRDDSKLDAAIDMVADLNCNMIRCWGGNVYEDHRFFDLCDQNGIMVWQDFAMGCTFYPQREEFAKALEREVTSVVLKLRSHPSLAIWSGNNEDDISLRWSLAPFNIDPNRDVVTRSVIPMVLYELDPTRNYLPSSPYLTPAIYAKGSKEELYPEYHLWGPRGYYKDPFYLNATCQFVSEIGYHGCPNRSSLEKMFTKGSVYPWINKEREWNDEWTTKSVRILPNSGKTVGRNNLMTNQVNLLFGSVPEDLDDFIFASQVVQAEAMKYFVEIWRGKKFDDKTGIIWWNVRDGWPIISDAIVDYYNSPKLAYYFIKNVQGNVCVLVNDATDATDGKHPLVAVNDTRNPTKGSVLVTDLATGKQIYKGDYSIEANAKTLITKLPQMTGQGMLLIRYQDGDGVHYNHYLYGKAPFQLKEYRKLLQKSKIYTLI